jgi:hypothetical protein
MAKSEVTKKAPKCLRCQRRKVGSKHTAEQHEMARMGRQARLLSRAILQPFTFKDKERRPTYLGGSRDAFVEARRVLAVKNGDKLLRTPEEKRDDGKIHAFHFACRRCDVQASGADCAVVTRGHVHDALHTSVAMQRARHLLGLVPDINLR